MVTDEAILAGASWLWLPGEESRAPNTYALFRRTFVVAGVVNSAATLYLSADARYELFVNGEWVGHGPPRSFPSPWPVDGYDMAPLLQPGRNVIAVLVHHYGIGTFQYLEGSQPGLIARLQWTDDSGAHELATDGAWRCHQHQGFARVVPRISCQQAWEEQFDAQSAPETNEWRQADYDDAAWPAAVVVGAAGAPPHERFEARDIPFLSREPVYPVRVLRTDIVRPERL